MHNLRRSQIRMNQHVIHSNMFIKEVGVIRNVLILSNTKFNPVKFSQKFSEKNKFIYYMSLRFQCFSEIVTDT